YGNSMKVVSTAAPARLGRPPSTTRAKVVETALSIAREDGLAHVTLQAVADRLGFSQMSLYTYIDSKEDLLRAMLDAAIVDALPPLEPRADEFPARTLREI